MTDVSDRVQIHDTKILAHQKYTLKSIDFSWRRGDGSWQRLTREMYDKGNGAAILLYNRAQKSVVLIRQFRLPAFLGGQREMLIEVPAGMLDGAAPEERIKSEVEEETGYAVRDVTRLFEAFMSPGAVSEKLIFFAGEYDPGSRPGAGGGLAHEAEDIEVLEVSFADALTMISDGRVADAKTIMLLQWAALHLFQ
jgi:nudix-type nucleoside diphosphatase (YffH/AdpP family)